MLLTETASNLALPVHDAAGAALKAAPTCPLYGSHAMSTSSTIVTAASSRR